MTDVVAVYLSGETVRRGVFVEFRFASETKRVWNGFRNIEIGGYLWEPVGPNATVDQIEDPITDQVPSIELRVSGVEADLLAIALSEADQVRGRLAFIYDTYFDPDWQPLLPLENYATVRMDNVKVSKKPDGQGGTDRVISIEAQHLMTAGASAPAGRYSVADQETRHPGDGKYFEFIPALQNKVIRWPTY